MAGIILVRSLTIITHHILFNQKINKKTWPPFVIVVSDLLKISKSSPMKIDFLTGNHINR
jgi:hypothetical protein